MVPSCSLLQTMPSKLDKIQTITCAAAYWNHLQVRVPLIMVHWAIALTETHLGQKPVPFSSWEETLRSNERLAGPPCWSHPSLVMILVARSTVAAYIYIYSWPCNYSMNYMYIFKTHVSPLHSPTIGAWLTYTASESRYGKWFSCYNVSIYVSKYYI